MIGRWFIEGVKREDELFWITEIGGHIMKLNMKSLQAEYVNVDGIEGSMSSSAFVYEENGVLYLIANSGKKLVMLSKENKVIKNIELDFQKKHLNILAFVGKYGNELIIVPRCDNEVIRINIETSEVYTDDTIIETKIDADKELRTVYAKCDITQGDMLYIFSTDTKQMIQYNLKTREKTYEKLPELLGRPQHIIKDEEIFYILNEEGCVCTWDSIGGSCEKLFNNPNEAAKADDFSLIYLLDNKLWLMPALGDDIYTFDIVKNEIEVFDDYPKELCYSAPETMGKYTAKIEDEDNCYFTMHAGNYIFYIDKKTGEGKWLNTKWPTEKETLTYLLNKGETTFNEGEMVLGIFIEYVKMINWRRN